MKLKIIYQNEVPEQYKNDEIFIKNIIEYFANESSLNIKLKIKFIEDMNINRFEITDCALQNFSPKNHILYITYSILKSISYDGGKDFAVAIFHELKHIEDYVNTMKTECFNFNIGLETQKTYEREYISEGHKFWTEVYVYYETIKFAKLNNISYKIITFGELVKSYEKIIRINKELYYKKDLKYKEAKEYIDCVKSFTYLCSKFMASAYAGNSRVPYKKIQTKENINYRKVYRILSFLSPSVLKIFKNPYSQKSYSQLLNLGKKICVNVHWKTFKVGLTKKNGRIRKFY